MKKEHFLLILVNSIAVPWPFDSVLNHFLNFPVKHYKALLSTSEYQQDTEEYTGGHMQNMGITQNKATLK